MAYRNFTPNESLGVNIAGNILFYTSALMGLASAIKNPEDFGYLLAYGIGAGIGKAITRMPDIIKNSLETK
jgi:hypothetical protein